MTRHLKLFLLVLLFVCFGSSLPAKAGTFDLLIPIEECAAPLTTGEYLGAFEGFMWADPVVSFTTIEGPKWGPCGEFLWRIKWSVNPAPAADAWIVQHMVFKFNVLNCDGTPGGFKDADYYEAWRVGTNGQAKSSYSYDFAGNGTSTTVTAGSTSYDDTWSVPSEPNTKGSWSIDGDAAYQASITAGEFTTPNRATYAGILPATTNKPTGFGNATIHRHADAKWDCCSTTTTTVGTATASNAAGTYTESWTWNGTKMVHTKDGQVVTTVTPVVPLPPLSALAALVHSSPAWDGTRFDPAQLIRVANQLQAMGRGGALQALHAYRDELNNAPGEWTMNSTRIGLLVRVLFLSPAFPRMQVGLGHLSDDVAATLPLYPLTLNQDVPLLVDPSFALLGSAEDPLAQIQFCEEQCTFRSTPLTPAGDISRVALQIPSTSADSRNVSLMQAQVLRMAKGVCGGPGLENHELFANPGLSRMLESCMRVFQSGGAVWDPATNEFKRR